MQLRTHARTHARSRLFVVAAFIFAVVIRYRGIARDLQDRMEELQQQHDDLATANAVGPQQLEQHEEEVRTLQGMVEEKQRALDFASEEVAKLDQQWRDKV